VLYFRQNLTSDGKKLDDAAVEQLCGKKPRF